MTSWNIEPNHILHWVKPAVGRTVGLKFEGEKRYYVSSTELNRNLRNPLTSLKMLLDLIYLYVPDNDFVYRAFQIMAGQIGRMENYLNYLEETAFTAEGDEGGEGQTCRPVRR